MHCPTSKLSDFLASYRLTIIYDLLGSYASHASEFPQGIIPSSLIVIPYCPDIVFYNEKCNLVALFELICPLDSINHLESVRDRKQSKEAYHKLYQSLNV